MNRVAFAVPGRMPNMNDLMLNRGTRIRGKATHMDACAAIASVACAGKPPMLGAHVHVHCIEPNMRRDPDGVVAGATKIVLDALQACRAMPNDGWRGVASIRGTWDIDRANPRVVVTVEW